MKRLLPIPFVLLLILPTMACSAMTQEDAQLNHQTRMAGGVVKTKAEKTADLVKDGATKGKIDPALAESVLNELGALHQAGADIKENAGTLGRYLPDVPNPEEEYSPEASAAARKASVEADRQPFLLGLLTDITGALGWEWATTALTTIFGLFMFMKKRGTDRKLKGTYEGVQLAINGAKDGKTADAIKAAVKAGQQGWNVWNEIAPEIKRLREKGELSQDKTKETG